MIQQIITAGEIRKNLRSHHFQLRFGVELLKKFQIFVPNIEMKYILEYFEKVLQQKVINIAKISHETNHLIQELGRLWIDVGGNQDDPTMESSYVSAVQSLFKAFRSFTSTPRAIEIMIEMFQWMANDLRETPMKNTLDQYIDKIPEELMKFAYQEEKCFATAIAHSRVENGNGPEILIADFLL
jgi:hypothetical protein